MALHGVAVARGWNKVKECDIPPLEKGVSYAQVSAGRDHTVLLRSDGTAVAFGLNDDGQCNLPLLEEGVSYTQVSAGRYRTVLLRCDGRVVACGKNSAIPPDFNALVKDRVLQADFSYEDNDEIIVRCFGLDGVEVLQLRASGSDLARQTSKELALQLNSDMQDPRVILPDGELLDVVCRANPNGCKSK